MVLTMSGLDYNAAPIALREQLSFTRNGVVDMDRIIAESGDLLGVVLLSTCNRTELYLSCAEGDVPDAGEVLCRAAGARYADFAHAFVRRSGEDCARHLMEVACGLRSQILGEDQILSQVKTAIALAREAGTSDGVLETLFRTAAACGKAAKTAGRLTNLPASAAHQAVAALEGRLGSLSGRRALVIGNGEMGRLTAALLHSAGCAVTVTLRSYRHGETVVPAGCAVAPYDDRYGAMEGMDLLVSATTSPHYTVMLEPFTAVQKPPKILVDLAIPRDIQPELGERVPGVTLLNVDDLSQRTGADAKELARVHGTIGAYLERFYQWNNYRESLPAIEELKAALRQRMGFYVDADMDTGEVAALTIDKVVDLLAGGMTDGFTADAVQACTAKIRAHTRA